MKEDEYIDLDKINEVPKEGVSGLPKEEKQEIKKTSNKQAKKTTKKTTKKTSNKQTKKNKNSNNKKIIYALLGLILVAILVIAIFNLVRVEPETKESRVLLLINGEPLDNEVVETRANWLRLVGEVPITDEQALELSIDVTLMAQEAKKRNITVDDEELDMIFQDMAISAEMTEEELIEYIKELGINYELLRTIVKQEMHARKLSEEVLKNLELAEEELLNYYEENQEQFSHEELAKIRHIQINFQENKTENETLQNAQEIKQELKINMTNFCELVELHSDDWNTLDTCGEYVLEKQETYTDELTNKSFELEEGETDIIKTEAGYHILWKVEKIPAGISDFEDVKERIRAQLQISKAEEIHFELVEKLREQATIEDYTEDTLPENVISIINETEELMNETEIIEEIIEPIEDLINETEELLNETETTEELAEPTEEAENETETTEELAKPTEEAENETETTEELAEPIITIEDSTLETEKRQLRLAKCLTEQGAKMYDVYWAPHGEKQAEAFGDYFEHIIRIECDADGKNPKVTECKQVLQKEYPTWPTWVINDEIHEGYQNLHTLSRISGCPY